MAQTHNSQDNKSGEKEVEKKSKEVEWSPLSFRGQGPPQKTPERGAYG